MASPTQICVLKWLRPVLDLIFLSHGSVAAAFSPRQLRVAAWFRSELVLTFLLRSLARGFLVWHFCRVAPIGL